MNKKRRDFIIGKAQDFLTGLMMLNVSRADPEKCPEKYKNITPENYNKLVGFYKSIFTKEFFKVPRIDPDISPYLDFDLYIEIRKLLKEMERKDERDKKKALKLGK